LGYEKEDTNLYGNTYYDTSIDAVTAAIDASLDINSDEFIGTLAHELKHCFQFETGNLSFSEYGGAGKLYDFQDEVEAHKRGGLFGASKSYPDENYNKIPKNNINIGTSNKKNLDNNYYINKKILK
jgi:hypothetical protein